MSSSTQKRSQSRHFPRMFSLRPGAIPPELGRLTNLKELNLFRNALSGTFADSLPICVCPVLHKRSESRNFPHTFPWCTGAIPPELGQLTNLTQLVLAGNKLEGAYDDSLPKMICFRICVCPVLHKKEAKFVELSFCSGSVPEGERACIHFHGPAIP